ncbi:MAG: DsbE family thiol:disulfide interchange protein, partial [Xanthomonadales bacterium]|nr:DsbE family thiol:disulfide interchange protein [Xanthomonadales bacterium]
MARVLPLVVFVLLGILLAAGLMLSDSKSEIPSPLVGKAMPEFELPRLDDPFTLVSSETLKGAPFLLNVWASWCVTCRYEHPVIEQLARMNVIPIIGLNYRDPRDNALEWLLRFGDPYDLHIADEPGRVAIDFGVYAAPETFLIDADGVIRYKHIGALTPEIVEDELLP